MHIVLYRVHNETLDITACLINITASGWNETPGPYNVQMPVF
jgi:hypothetical protein